MQASTEQRSTKRPQADDEQPPAGSTCAFPNDVIIHVNGESITVDGKNTEELPAGDDGKSKLTAALLPCAVDHHFSFELDPKTTMAQVLAAFVQTPTNREHVDTVRVGTSPARSIQRQSSAQSVGHWLRLTVGPNGSIDALEVARDSGQGGAPLRVVREVHPHTLAEAFAFARSTCAKRACAGLIFTPAPDSSASVLDSAILAATKPGAPPLLLELRDLGGGDSDDLLNVGRLPPEVIQRTVRQSYSRFRMCYETGLARKADLEGTVSIRFIIDRDGEVRQSAAESNTLPDPDVVTCVVEGFKQVHFPKPVGGIVTVVYPIVFSPG